MLDDGCGIKTHNLQKQIHENSEKSADHIDHMQLQVNEMDLEKSSLINWSLIILY